MNGSFRWLLAGLAAIGMAPAWCFGENFGQLGLEETSPQPEQRGFRSPDRGTGAEAISAAPSRGENPPELLDPAKPTRWGGQKTIRPSETPELFAPEAPDLQPPFPPWTNNHGAPASQNRPQNSSLLLPEKDLQEPVELGQPIPLKPQPWTWQLLPQGLIYRSYLAGVKEPRCGIVFNHDTYYGWIWDIGLGARLGVIRYGNDDPLHPEGIQLDFEGAALLRIDPEEDRDVVGCDYRYGIPLTWGSGPIRTKFGFYHLSAHLGDEFLLKNPGIYRDNYVRDSLVFGKSLYLTPALRFYGEVAWAFNTDGRAKPWEFQCGMDFSPLRVGQWRGAPFLALNGHWRQEFDYHGSFTLQTGWQWRNGHGATFRLGMQYYRGKSEQWSLADRSEDKIGLGIWYDF